MDRPVPLLDLKQELESLRPELDVAIARVLDSGRFIGGPEVESFEHDLARAAGCQSAVGVSSGTDALLISLMALGIGPGDEVVTTPFSFFATAGVIARLGARPVFADIDAETFNLSPRAAESAIGERTRAVMPVNLYGLLAKLPETSVPVVEDAAQSIGVGGCRGTLAGISFFPTKNVGAYGDAGAVLVNDAALADRVRLLRTQGARPKYHHPEIGGNFRLDALQAAILQVKLQRLGEWTEARRQTARRYLEAFAGAALPAEFEVPVDHADHVYHQFTVRAPNRDSLRSHLQKSGIASEIYYPLALHLQPCLADLGYREGAFPEAERATREVLSLPVHPSIPADAVDRVVSAIENFYR